MINFENVSMTYPNGTPALDNVSLQIGDGEFVFIVGSSDADEAASPRGEGNERQTDRR